MKSILTLIILIISLQNLSADYKQAIKSLNENNIDLAIENFEEAISNNDNVEKSTLYLAILKEYEQPNPQYTYSLLKSNVESYEYIATALWGGFFGKASGHEYTDFFEFLEDEVESIEYSQLQNEMYEALGVYYKSIANYSESKDKFNKLNNYFNWQVVGVFENTSGSGFDKSYAPISNPKSEAIFNNRYNAKVKWFDLNIFGRGEWLRYKYFFDITDAIMYAQTFIESTKDTIIQGRIGVSGSVKVWTNDQVVFKEEEEPNNGQDSYIFEVALKKGWNRVLVQIGSSENNSANFIFRLTDPEGKDIENLNVSSKYKDYQKLSGENITLFKNQHVKHIEDLIRKEPNEIIYKMLLFKEHIFTNNFNEANDLRKEINEMMPNTLMGNLLDMEYFFITRNSTLYNNTIEKIKSYSDIYPTPLFNIWEQELENKNIQALEVLLEKMKSHPKHFDDSFILQRELSLDALRNNYQNMIKKCIEGNNDFPNDVFYVNVLMNYYYTGTKEYYKAIDIVKDYLENNHDYTFMTYLSSLYIQTGERDEGITVVEDYIDRFPYATGAYDVLSNIYLSSEEYDKALEYINKGLKIAPYFSQFHASYAQILQQKNEVEKAKESYKSAIEYNPLDYKSRSNLSNLEGEVNIFNKFETPNLDSIYSSSAADSENDITILHDEIQSVAYENGGFEQKYYLLLKANNSKGIDLLKEYDVPVYNNQRYQIEEAYLLKTNNSKLKAEQNETFLVFPNIEVGDAIKIVYKLWTYNGYAMTNHFWDEFQMSSYYPVQKSKYILAVEGDKAFNYHVANNDTLKPTESNIGDFKVYNWELNNMKSIKYESYMPSTEDVATCIYVSSIPSWEYVVDWYKDMTNNKIESHDYYRSILDKLIDKDDSDFEKAHKIYQYVVKEIRYSSISFRQSGYIPQKSNILIDEKLGDCKDISTLFVNLCKEEGLDANLVLANTRDNGLNSLPLPSVNFDHCIAQLNIDKTTYYIETTNEFLPFASVPFWMKNELLLPIKDGSDRLINMKNDSGPKNAVIRNTTLTFENENLLTEKISIKYGDRASSMRSTYLYLTEKERTEEMEKAIIDEDPSLSLIDLKFDSSLEDVSDSVSYTYKYTQPQKFIEVGEMLVFEIDWTEKFSSTDFVASSKRLTQIELHKYFSTVEAYETINISFPKGTKLSELPKDIKVSNSIFDYSLNFKMENGTLICKRLFNLNKDFVNIEEYELFKEDIKVVVKSDKTNLIFKKG